MVKHFLLGLALVVSVEDRPVSPAADSVGVIRVFFSPDSPDASAIFKQLEGHDVRPVLLVESYRGPSRLKKGFLETVRVSGEVLVVDAEGLREAERLGITSLPAVAVTHGGRTHVAVGTNIDIGKLLKCSR